MSPKSTGPADPKDVKFEALLDFLRRSRGFDFTGYKRSSLMRRVRKRMYTVGIADFADYMDYLEVHPEEFTLLFNTILINVTGFFRDSESWQYLNTEVLPRIIRAHSPKDQIRAWSVGCASGEEAYTLAILLAEALGAEQFRDRVKIYATDVDEEALVQARQAGYTAEVLEAVPEELRERYFEKVASRYVFRSDLRRSVIFGRHDLIQDAPISRLDLLVCRNTLMYFNAETQSKILARFHFALDKEGYLFLGKAEMLLTHAALFTPLDVKHRIFAKVPRVTLGERLVTAGEAGVGEINHQVARYVRLRETAYDLGMMANLAVDANGIVVLANEPARKLFSLTGRDLGRPLAELPVSYRPVELLGLIDQAYADRREMIVPSVEHMAGGEMRYLDVCVTPLPDNGGSMLGASISFVDVTRIRAMQEDVQRFKQELETAYEELQSTNEELETTNEELQSTIEELETTNEELQSTNEELETMNEELQSTNEELETMNMEMVKRTEESSHINAFLESILSSLNAGVVVVGRDLDVLSWNRRSEDLWGLRSEEANGKPFFNLDIGLPTGQLMQPILNCLSGNGDHEEIDLEAVNRRGKQIQVHVRCTPLTDRNSERVGAILWVTDLEGHDGGAG